MAAVICGSARRFIEAKAAIRLPAVLGRAGSAVVLDTGGRVTSVAPLLRCRIGEAIPYRGRFISVHGPPSLGKANAYAP